MPWACSSLSASRRKAYSNGFELRSHERPDLLQLALGQGMRVGQQPADDRALAVIDVADDDDVHPLWAVVGAATRFSGGADDDMMKAISPVRVLLSPTATGWRRRAYRAAGRSPAASRHAARDPDSPVYSFSAAYSYG